jgi:dTMP kinase
VARGRLITIEGIDGAGKTTLAAGLAAALRERGLDVEPVREPGGVELSERIRELLIDPRRAISPRAEALLYAAARAQLVAELLEPRLGEGAVLILDRFADSSLAYQGAGRSLGVEPLRALNGFATGDLVPDRTLLLRVPAAIGRSRLEARSPAPDRMEGEADGFFTSVASAYEELAAAEPGRFRVLDGSAPVERVLADGLDALSDLFDGEPPARGHQHPAR